MAAVNSDANNDNDGGGGGGGGGGRLKVYTRRSLRRQRDIPEDIVIRILSRLPVESLLRFRCVSKAWLSLISDPKFTLDSSQRRNKIAIRTAHGLCNDHSGIVYSVDDDVVYRTSRIKRMGNNKNLEWFQILGSCNGLLLVSHYTDLYLWNPSTRQRTKVLSLPSDHGGEGAIHNVVNGLSASCGLCYDSSHDDYTVVMAACNDKPSYSVASFRKKNWATTTCRFANEMNSGSVVNEKLHWVVIQHGNNGFSTDRIVYFDPITDEFLELPAPPGGYSFRGLKRVMLGLGVLEGCLCMARIGCESGDEVEPGVTDFFVMREYSVGESWSSIFVTSIFMGLARQYEFGNLVPLCYTKNGEVLLVLNKNKLLVYNPDKTSQWEIPIPSDHYLIDVAPYTESLASPAAYGHEEEEEEEGEEDAEKFVDFESFCWDCYYSRDSLISPWRKVPVIIPMMWKGCGKTENLEKFKRRIDKTRPKFLAEKEKTKVKRLVED